MKIKLILISVLSIISLNASAAITLHTEIYPETKNVPRLGKTRINSFHSYAISNNTGSRKVYHLKKAICPYGGHQGCTMNESDITLENGASVTKRDEMAIMAQYGAPATYIATAETEINGVEHKQETVSTIITVYNWLIGDKK